MPPQTIDIRYQTLTLPPPYAYQYHLRIELTDSRPRVALHWRYTGRDELSEEEIWEEGFTPHDDFQWKGSLPAEWSAPLRLQLEQTAWLSEEAALDEAAAKDASLTFTVTRGGRQTTEGIPRQAAEWEYLLQELVQGIYEVSGRELPLRIRYLDIAKNHQSEAMIEAQFAQRRLTVTTQTGGLSSAQELPWSALRPLLSALYVPDYHTDRTQSDTPRQHGQYIHPGDAWYRLGRAVTNPGKTDTVANLRQALAKVIASD